MGASAGGRWGRGGHRAIGRVGGRRTASVTPRSTRARRLRQTTALLLLSHGGASHGTAPDAPNAAALAFGRRGGCSVAPQRVEASCWRTFRRGRDARAVPLSRWSGAATSCCLSGCASMPHSDGCASTDCSMAGRTALPAALRVGAVAARPSTAVPPWASSHRPRSAHRRAETGCDLQCLRRGDRQRALASAAAHGAGRAEGSHCGAFHTHTHAETPLSRSP